MIKNNNLKIKIAVCGSSGGYLDKDILRKAHIVGQEIAKNNAILFTGMTSGYSYEAVKGNRAKKGMSIGISPADSKANHLKNFEKVNFDFWTTNIYSGLGYKMRDILMIRSIDTVVIIGGGTGTLVELAAAIDYQKVIGILKDSRGAAMLYKSIEKISYRFKPLFIVNANPKILIKRLVEFCNQHRKNEL